MKNENELIMRMTREGVELYNSFYHVQINVDEFSNVFSNFIR